MFLIFLLTSCLADDLPDSADSGGEGTPLDGAWRGEMAADWAFADGAGVVLAADVVAWASGGSEIYARLHLLGGTSVEGAPDADVEGHVDLAIEVPLVAGAQVLVRSYSASEPCSWVYAEDPEHFACPFAAGDAWSWDGADTIEQRREAPEGPSTLTLARGG